MRARRLPRCAYLTDAQFETTAHCTCCFRARQTVLLRFQESLWERGRLARIQARCPDYLRILQPLGASVRHP